MGVQIETVETGSFSMDYFRFGRGEKTLVILPGLSVQSVMELADAVAKAYEPLANDFTIYVFDRRRDLREGCRVRDLANDTAEALRALGLDRVCVFGASMGGMMAQELAIGHPDLVEKLVLGSTTPQLTEAQYRTMEKWAEMAARRDAKGLYLAFGEAIFPPATFELMRKMLENSARNVTVDELGRFIIQAHSMKGFDVLADLESISCPILLLEAADDEVIGPDAVSQFTGALGGRPDFELYMYDGYGHAAYDTAPGYKDRILRFLTA